VLFAAALWPRWPYEVIQHAIRGDFHLVLTQLVIDQAREGITARFPVEIERLDRLLRLLKYEEVPAPSPAQVARHHDLVRDETEVPVALAAINARVDYLISEDKDLTTQGETTAQLRERLKVRLSGTFLREVMEWTGEELERVQGRTWRNLETPEE
jgi:predicted nucleic acid-binding protein